MDSNFLETPFSVDGINFVAIDIETANSDRSSICEFGLTVVKNSVVYETKTWLIRPHGNFYDEFNISIHGITPEMTENCMELPDVWPEIASYLNGHLVVAHNTSFDAYSLRDALNSYNLEYPDFLFLCSYRAATKIIKDCYSYSLPILCNHLCIDFDIHHRAGSDSQACAKLFLELLRRADVLSFSDFNNKYRFSPGVFSNNFFKPALTIRDYSNKKNISVSDIVGDPSKIDEGSYFYGKEVCFSGKCLYGTRAELLQKIADIGGIPVNSVTKTTDILVVGQQDYRVVGESGMSSKQKKAMSLKDSGSEIEIMSESEFLLAI